MNTLFQIYESFHFAWRALRSNLLRTILSLLGVTIGIFTIILVFTLVDSLEKNIRDSLSFIGTGTIYVEKWPWMPDNNGETRWWDFWGRPNASYAEYKFLEGNLRSRSSIAIFARKGNITIRRNSNSIGQVRLVGGSEGYDNIFTVDVEKGRFLSANEINGGRNVVVIGYEVALALFPNNDNPIGQDIKIKNMRYRVVGVVKKEGQSFSGAPSNDHIAIVPYNSFRKFYQTGSGRADELSSSIAVKGFDSDLGLVELENELRGMLRMRRAIRPAAKDNFAMNRPEALSNAISGIFDVFNIAGAFIGGFSVLVGGFGIANIMFVSVKERTSIIGVQKSLGAKNYVILFQFLFEAIFLSLIGGLGGLFLAYLITLIPIGMDVSLTLKNVVVGMTISTVIGLIAGIVPAALAARLDPVVAIRA